MQLPIANGLSMERQGLYAHIAFDVALLIAAAQTEWQNLWMNVT